MKDLKEQISDLEDQLDVLLDFYEKIKSWSLSYPEWMFPELDSNYLKRANKALKAEGITLDRLSGAVGRHIFERIRKDIKDVEERLDRVELVIRDERGEIFAEFTIGRNLYLALVARAGKEKKTFERLVNDIIGDGLRGIMQEARKTVNKKEKKGAGDAK